MAITGEMKANHFASKQFASGQFTPEQARGKLLLDHAYLGELLKQVGRLAYRWLDGESAAAAPLREAILALGEPLSAHLDFEDLFLPKIIGHAPWGPMHVLHARVNHAHQSDCLRHLEAQARDLASDENSLTSLAEEALALVRELVQDIAREEHDLVHPDVLGAPASPASTTLD